MIRNPRPASSAPRGRTMAAFESLEPRTLLAILARPSVSIADASVDEGNSGTKTMAFIVSLSAPARSTCSVSYSTVSGSATHLRQDYTATSGRLIFARGSSQATVAIRVKGDATVEADETFRVVLSTPVGCSLGRSSATGTIVNDDGVLPPPPPPTVAGSWTVLVYMTGETLNPYARLDINEMEKALTGLPSSVRTVVAWDQPSASVANAYATGGGAQAAWRTYGRSVLSADANMTTIASTFDLSPGEQNTGDPATLVDFVKWGVAQAPAAHYALQLWGHGGGLDGSQFDSESNDDALTIPEIATALGAAGMPAIDLVSYDNCLMGMVEVGTAIAPHVGGVFVASEESINGTGQDYTTAYAALNVANPAQVTAAQLAVGMVSSFGAQYLDNPDYLDTLSATTASGYANLAAAIRTFVTDSTALSAADRNAILAAVATDAVTYLTPFDTTAFCDLGSFMAVVGGVATLPPAVRTAASGVTTALTAVVASKTTDQRDSSGLSIYLPTDPADEYLATYPTDAAAFCALTGWDTFATWMATGTRSIAKDAAPAAASKARPFLGRAGTKALAGDGNAMLWSAFATLAADDSAGVASDGRPRRFAVRADTRLSASR